MDSLCPLPCPSCGPVRVWSGELCPGTGHKVCMLKVQIRACTIFLFCTRDLVQFFPHANSPRVYGPVQDAKMIIDSNYN